MNWNYLADIYMVMRRILKILNYISLICMWLKDQS